MESTVDCREKKTWPSCQAGPLRQQSSPATIYAGHSRLFHHNHCRYYTTPLLLYAWEIDCVDVFQYGTEAQLHRLRPRRVHWSIHWSIEVQPASGWCLVEPSQSLVGKFESSALVDPAQAMQASKRISPKPSAVASSAEAGVQHCGAVKKSRSLRQSTNQRTVQKFVPQIAEGVEYNAILYSKSKQQTPPTIM